MQWRRWIAGLRGAAASPDAGRTDALPPEGDEPIGGPVMELIVGLGNPGPEYERTPHNLGFLTIDRLAKEEGIRLGRREANAEVGRGVIGGKTVMLAKPLSYMNRSGGPVKALLDKYGLNAGQLLVIYDELALPWMQLRIREKGSAAGHRGVESVIESLQTETFRRLRMGVDPGHPVQDAKVFLLRPFRRREAGAVDEFVGRAVDAARHILSEGAAKAMPVYNRRAQGSNIEEQ